MVDFKEKVQVMNNIVNQYTRCKLIVEEFNEEELKNIPLEMKIKLSTPLVINFLNKSIDRKHFYDKVLENKNNSNETLKTVNMVLENKIDNIIVFPDFQVDKLEIEDLKIILYHELGHVKYNAHLKSINTTKEDIIRYEKEADEYAIKELDISKDRLIETIVKSYNLAVDYHNLGWCAKMLKITKDNLKNSRRFL